MAADDDDLDGPRFNGPEPGFLEYQSIASRWQDTQRMFAMNEFLRYGMTPLPTSKSITQLMRRKAYHDHMTTLETVYEAIRRIAERT